MLLLSVHVGINSTPSPAKSWVADPEVDPIIIWAGNLINAMMIRYKPIKSLDMPGFDFNIGNV